MSATVRGILFMSAATVGFAIMHAAIRHMSSAMHPFEIAFFRNFFGLIVIAPWYVRYGLAPLRTKKFPLHALRAGFNVVAMLTFFYALSITPLAKVTALGFTAPIFATILAIFILGEVVRLRRLSAIAIGFIGTLIIVRPGIEAIGLGSVLMLISTAIWACALIVIKILARTESSVTIASYMLLMMIPLSLVPAVFVWRWPTPIEFGWLVAIGIIGTMAQLSMTQALKEADTTVVLPFDFLKLIWASILGFLAFGETPSVYTWIGGAVIFASTTYISYREAVIARASRRDVGPRAS